MVNKQREEMERQEQITRDQQQKMLHQQEETNNYLLKLNNEIKRE